MKNWSGILTGCLVFAAAALGRASSVIPMELGDLIGAAAAVCRGTVVSSRCSKGADGLIHTRTALRVDEKFKGIFPAIVLVVHRGGQLGDEEEFFGGSPVLQPGGEYVLFLSRRADGTLYCLQGPAGAIRLHRETGMNQFDAAVFRTLDRLRRETDNGRLAGADVTDQAGAAGVMLHSVTASGLLEDTIGISARFIAPDRGEAIPYLIDADNLPAGITLTQATSAVAAAFAAWTAVTKLSFRFAGIQSFGTNADAVIATDETIRIQLHDDHNAINDPTTLAYGGRSAAFNVLSNAGWDIGGNVNGREFHKSTRGYVVMERTNATLSDLSIFTEVLCHELGHVLSLAHSSETPGETNALLNQAIMYYQIKGGGRGATLGAYDPPIIQKAYPADNTPPFTYSRVMDAITAPSTPAVAGINEVEMRGYDLQTTNLTLALTNDALLNGAFTDVGNRARFIPALYYDDSPRADPAGNAHRGRVYARFSDGTNASPYVSIRVLSLRGDGDQPADGLPDYWMLHFFGHADSRAGDRSRAADDADGDGLSNLQEFIAGMNPTNGMVAQRIQVLTNGTLQFQAKAYEFYEILGSTNLTAWARVGDPITPTNASPFIRTNLPDAPIMASVSNLPPAGQRMFYRVNKVP